MGPPDDKNFIAVFTSRAAVQKAVGDGQNILFPVTLNGKTLLEQARAAGRGICINPTDETATVPLPAEMMAKFLNALG